LEKRLIIAKECHDVPGQRRAHGNLGNAYLYLDNCDKALHHYRFILNKYFFFLLVCLKDLCIIYREALTNGELMNDTTFIARTYFTIGRIYALKQDYDTSIYFHEKHLNLACQLNDSVGQCRAYLILSQLYKKIEQNEKANKYESLHRALA
ncbi:unnamed protein product, partial [Didymodactylos carnosus]